ncbi:fumarylacetoacetate hydrolase family protein [Mumia sp.]|uniref:fumarylacetoacetate hydrolase family protein n=1 Tax=Mumia sp. TaxID=1965300 RepID=UPI002621ED66|nr:fumarylacetoacetate hydrolase family protein [Mumia sp.]MDD9348091.1 fumarylacetoacetate hydrolase family protein [Mumia sp.]
MRLSTIQLNGRPTACVTVAEGLARIDQVLPGAPDDVMALLEGDRLGELARAIAAGVDTSALVDPGAAVLTPWTRPRKILGIGLNYRAHAGDLGEEAPRTSPASFLKADHTIVGPGEPIVVPGDLGTVTSEAELGLVVGRPCYRVSVDEAMAYVAGVVAVLDQTAEEVLLENPRYLTRVKNYPTFFAFGPELITLDEVLAEGPLEDLRVATIHNGAVHREDVVGGMTFSPAELLSFHSHVMPFFPGDILSTGTPGAVAIQAGDTVRCELGDGLSFLENPVRTVG